MDGQEPKINTYELPPFRMRWLIQSYDQTSDDIRRLRGRDDEDIIAEREFIFAYIEYLEYELREVMDLLTKEKQEYQIAEKELYQQDRKIVELERRLNMPFAPMLGGGGSRHKIVTGALKK